MLKSLRATAVGGAAGLAVGVTIAFFHLNAPVFVFRGLALSPSVGGLLLGGVAGLLIGLIAGLRKAAKKKQTA